jgi:hypothetical protein
VQGRQQQKLVSNRKCRGLLQIVGRLPGRGPYELVYLVHSKFKKSRLARFFCNCPSRSRNRAIPNKPKSASPSASATERFAIRVQANGAFAQSVNTRTMVRFRMAILGLTLLRSAETVIFDKRGVYQEWSLPRGGITGIDEPGHYGKPAVQNSG